MSTPRCRCRDLPALAALLLVGCGAGGPSGEPDGGFLELPPPRRPPACDGPDSAPFCDATEAGGVDFSQIAYPGDPTLGGIALADFDGDGLPDIFVAGLSSPSVMYRNRGGMRFEDVSAEVGLANLRAATGVAVADYDNDGDQDLLVLRHDLPLQLHANAGDGTFTDVSEAAGVAVPPPAGRGRTPVSAAFADVDRDGRLDFYVGHWVDAGSGLSHPGQLFWGRPGGTFVEVGAAAGVALTDTDFTQAVAFADIDDDGDDDLLVSNDLTPLGGAPSRLLINHTEPGGAPRFVDEAAARGAALRVFGMSATPADYDDDGDLDLYVANLGRNVMLRNQGGQFTDVARELGVDVYGYVNPAIPVADFGDSPPLFRESADQFVRDYLDPEAGVHVATSWGSELFDYDNDGDLDLYVTSGWIGFFRWSEGRRQPDVLLRNDGAGYTDVTAAAMEVGSELCGGGLAVGDLDADGDLDVVVGSQAREGESQGPLLLRNDAAAHAAVSVRLAGAASNRDGIGARITAEVGDRTVHRHISGGHGILSSSPHQAWIGLGEASQVDRLTVRWPSGTVDTIVDIPAGMIMVQEGASAAPAP